ncbi:MAG TPA: alginate O-acetyltransferase [Bradyrhizobium sp.]|nr:alginate O-acetyltransferase [Bradyrhizobium sp.]
MANRAFSRPAARAAFCAFLALLPLGTAWNLLVARSHPSLTIKIGPKLGGVTYDTSVILSWAALRDGHFQKAVSSRITDAIPIRPLLIRINNELRFELFGELTAPQVVRGANNHLIERSYLNDYCALTEGMGAKFAADILPKLKDIQDYYGKRGGVFVYVVSPSKAAHLPEDFVDRVPCPSTPAARARLVPDYVGALKQAGIHVVDTASLIHSLKGTYPFDLFPQGGVHWNDVGGARAVSAIVEAINQQAGHEIIPPFKFSYTLSGVTGGADRELADLLNVFFPPLGYQTPKVSFEPEVPCTRSPARDLNVAMIGSSFGHLPARIMVEANCLTRLQFYYYAILGRFGGTPYRELQRNLAETDLKAVRDAKVMILEENESFVARAGYVDPLRALLNQP